jgi:hypothetical protein
MKRSAFHFLTLAAGALLLALPGCKKDEKETLDFDYQSTVDNSLAEGIFSDVNNIGNQAMENGSTGLTTYRGGSGIGDGSLLSPCATVTVTPDSAGNGGNLVVDFGNTNCLCRDFRYRRGRILVDYTGRYRDSLTVITTTFQDYYVGTDTSNMYQVLGTKTVTNKGRNGSGQIWFTVEVDGQLINGNNQTMEWNSSRTRTWTAGETTPLNWLDDEYLIGGTANGVSFERRSYTLNITTPLHVDYDCRWIRSGVIELTPQGKSTRVLDYGPDNCDNAATVTVNGTTFNITLR